MIKMVCMTWQIWCNAIIQVKRDQNPGQTIRVEVAFLPTKLKGCYHGITWQGCATTKLNGAGQP